MSVKIYAWSIAVVVAIAITLIPCKLHGQVSGTVFRDYNANGTREVSTSFYEPGVQAVTVTAYPASGATQTTATSASGTYSFTGLTLPARIEFTGLGVSDFSSAFGSGSGSSVQFVTAASTAVDFGINYPSDYCQADPQLAVTSFRWRNYDHISNKNQFAVVSDAYSKRNSSPPSSHDVNHALTEQVGNVFGLAYARKTETIYAGAFNRNMAGFGPGNVGSEGSSGAIYKISGGTISILLDLPTSEIGPNYHPKTGTDWFCDDAWRYLGENSWGDLDISDDEQTLFAVNLFNKKVYKINPISGAIISSHDIPTISGVVNSDRFPFALKFWKGKLYVGITDLERSTGNDAGVRAYVYSFDPSTNTFLQVLDADINSLNRGGTSNDWESRYQNTDNEPNKNIPWLTDIEFLNGDMLLGVRNMGLDNLLGYAGATWGPACTIPTGNSNSAGDLYKACFNGSTWTLESGGTCGGQSGFNSSIFYQQNVKHGNDYLGTMAVLPGKNEIAVTAIPGSGDGGVVFVNTNDKTWGPLSTPGRVNKIYDGAEGNFQKANGLGDLELLCDAAPVEIGNRVWADTDNDGIQDPGEPGISGVAVEIYSGTTLIGVAITDVNGNFILSNALGANTLSRIYGLNLVSGQTYTIRIPDVTGGDKQAALGIRNLTLVDQGSNDAIDSDGNLVGVNADKVIVFPNPGENNHTYDFGFASCPTVAVSATSNGPVCVGKSLTLNATPNGMASYAWSGPLSYTSSIQNPTVSSAATTGMAGTYRVTVTDANGCTGTGQVVVVVNALPSPTASANSPVCEGGTINLTSGPAGMASYSWAGPGGYTSTGQNPSRTNVTTAMAGTYTVTVTNTSGCSATRTVTVVVNTRPTATASNNGPLCAGAPLTLSSGPSGMTSYSWAGPNSFASTAQNPTVSTTSTAAMAGTYTVTVTNSSGCTATATTVVTVNAIPNFSTTVTNPTACIAPNNSGSVALSLLGGLLPAQVELSVDGGTFGAFATPVSGLAPGAHSFEIRTISSGCTRIRTASVGSPPGAPSVSINPLTNVCAGSSNITLSGTPAGGTFSGTAVTGNSFSPITAGPGTFTISYQFTDPGTGCTGVASTNITVFERPDANASGPNAVCSGTTIQLSAAPSGLSYAWTGPNSYSSSMQNPIVTTSATAANSGTYTLVVTDGNMCTASDQVAVTVNAIPTPTAANSGPVCVGDTVSLTATPSGLSYSWSGPAGFMSSDQNPEIAQSAVMGIAGVYTLTVTDGNLCTGTSSTTVVVHPLPVPLATTNSPLCVGDTLRLFGEPDGMAFYKWYNPAGGSNATFNVQDYKIKSTITSHNGTWTLLVRDANGCEATTTVEVTVNPLPAPFVSSNGPICAGETLELFSGPDGYTSYSWTHASNGFTSMVQNPTIPNAITSDGGIYTVVVTDANGCMKSKNVGVTVKNVPNPAFTIVSTPVCIGDTLKLNVALATATAYQWTFMPSGYITGGRNVVIDSVFQALYDGTVTLKITATNGCMAELTKPVSVLPKPSTPVNTSVDNVCPSTPGQFSATGSSLTWYATDPYLTVPPFSGGTSSAPAYSTLMIDTVWVTQTVGGCESDPLQIISDPELCCPNDGTPTNPALSICDNSTSVINLFDLLTGEDGGGTWTRTGGTGGTFNAVAGTFTPAPGATTSTFKYEVGGTGGCPVTSETVNVNINPAAYAGSGLSTVECAGSDTVVNLFDLLAGEQGGGAWTRVSGTGGAYTIGGSTYTISSTATTSIFRYTVTAVAPCLDDIEDVTVDVNPLLSVACTPLQPTCASPNGGSVTAVVSGGTASYTYIWSNGASGATITGLSAGTYSVTITDGNSCSANCSTVLVAPTGCCELLNLGLTIGTCDSKGTLTNATDDEYTFTLNPTGNGIGTTYTVNGLPNSPLTGTYGSAATFGPYLVSAGVLNISVVDNVSNTCTKTASVTPPPPCSVCDVLPPVLVVNDNICPNRTGSINLVQGCGAGTIIQYSTNNGLTWSRAKPLYSRVAKTILARCVNSADNSCMSVIASVTTDPKKCPGGGSDCSVIATTTVDPCQDNGTADVATDDYFTIQVNASASNGGATKRYEVVIGASLPSGIGGNVLNSGGTRYGSPVTVGQNKQFKADGSSSYVLIVRDIDNKSCFQQVNITPLAPCSGLPPKSPCYPVPCVPIGGSKN